jgi:nucleoid DNA-binding protein
MAAELAESHDLMKKQAEAVLGDLMALAIRHLKNGHKIRLTGLGLLHLQKPPKCPCNSQGEPIRRDVVGLDTKP